jgi:hypothetical protein
MTKIYISGPMTGYPEYNYPAFFEAESHLAFELSDVNILNPARIDDGEEQKFQHERIYYIRKSIELLLEATHIFVLPGWEKSEGAKLEIAIAKELGLKFLGNPVDVDDDIFEIAKNLVAGDRQKQYGPPAQNLMDIGRIWGALLQIDDISPTMVALMMTGLKLAREAHAPKKDNLVDAIGYIHIVDLLANKQFCNMNK